MAKAQRALRLNMLCSSFLMFQMKLTPGGKKRKKKMYSIYMGLHTERFASAAWFSSVCHQLRSIHLEYICIFIYLFVEQEKKQRIKMPPTHSLSYIAFYVWSYIDRSRKPKQTNKQNSHLFCGGKNIHTFKKPNIVIIVITFTQTTIEMRMTRRNRKRECGR